MSWTLKVLLIVIILWALLNLWFLLRSIARAVAESDDVSHAQNISTSFANEVLLKQIEQEKIRWAKKKWWYRFFLFKPNQ